MTDGQASSLRLDTVTSVERCVVVVQGVVDSATAPQLAAVIDAIAEDVALIELDLSELSFMDSTGVSVIAGILRRLEPLDGQLELRDVPQSVMRILTITNLLPLVVVLSHRSS